MRSQLSDDRIPPLRPLNLATDMRAHLPVKLDQVSIDRLHGLVSGTVNQREHFIETIAI